MNEYKVVHVPNGKRFEMDLGNNDKAVVIYQERNSKLYLTHSEVPMSGRGKGIGKILVEKTFEIIEAENLKAVAVCSYVKAVAEHSEKWSKIIEY